MKRTGALLLTVMAIMLLSKTAMAKPIAALLFPLSGPFSAMGTDMRKGSELAIEEINAKGGVLGNTGRGRHGG